jgi:hypothetical protein
LDINKLTFSMFRRLAVCETFRENSAHREQKGVAARGPRYRPTCLAASNSPRAAEPLRRRWTAVLPPPADEELLDELRLLLARRGKLTMSPIEASECTRHPNAYIRRFGSLTAAYQRIGYDMNQRQRSAAARFRKSD